MGDGTCCGSERMNGAKGDAAPAAACRRNQQARAAMPHRSEMVGSCRGEGEREDGAGGGGGREGGRGVG